MTTESDPAPVQRTAPPGYRYAAQWIRLGALIIDGLVLFVAIFGFFMVLGLALAVMGYPIADTETEGWPAGAVVYAVTSVIMLAWYGAWQAKLGGTPGMLLLKLRVRDPSGNDNPTLGQAVIRNAPQVLANFGPVAGSAAIDGVLALVTLAVYASIGVSIAGSPTRQGFHDRLAGGTYVVRPARATPPPQTTDPNAF